MKEKQKFWFFNKIQILINRETDKTKLSEKIISVKVIFIGKLHFTSAWLFLHRWFCRCKNTSVLISKIVNSILWAAISWVLAHSISFKYHKNAVSSRIILWWNKNSQQRQVASMTEIILSLLSTNTFSEQHLQPQALFHLIMLVLPCPQYNNALC